MTYALVFSGQGAQHPSMLPWLAEDDLVRYTCARLGVTDWRERLADDQWASSNANAQVLLTGLAVAAWQQISRGSPGPACVAGHSVGELAAFSTAGVFDPCQAIELATLRAEAMDRCGRIAPGGLLAVTGLANESIEALCMEFGVALSIRNGVDSVVLGGPEAALRGAELAANKAGGRATRLRVGVASHTRWMQAAADDFAHALAHWPLAAPHLILFSNVSGRVRDVAQARNSLAAQIARPVRWDQCVEEIHARGPDRVLEVGPGQVLARLWNQRHPNVPARSCDDFRSVSAARDWVFR